MSERHPPISRADHDDFCVAEGWSLVRGATGKPVQHHRVYELPLWDGRILRTRISRPVNGDQYAPSMAAHILRAQLGVTAAEFWDCVRSGVLPDRGAPPTRDQSNALPLFLIRELEALGRPAQEVLTLSPAEAWELRARLLAEPAEADSRSADDDTPAG